MTQLEQEFLSKIEKHQGIIYKVSRMYMDNEVDQEDLYQEIVYQLWKSYKSFKGDSQFSTWMYRVSLNTAISFFKKEKKQKEIEDKLKIQDNTEAMETNENPDKLDFLYKAINQLNDVDKALIFLYLEGLSHKEIGKNLGISEGNARVRLNRIKTKLEKTIKKYGYEF
mgnify:FL=1